MVIQVIKVNKIFSGIKGGALWVAPKKKYYRSLSRLLTKWGFLAGKLLSSIVIGHTELFTVGKRDTFRTTILLGEIAFLVLFFAPKISIANSVVEVNLKALSAIESSNNQQAVSFLGEKYGRGLYQISEVLLLDFNQQRKMHYINSDLFKPEVNKEIALWALNVRIPQVLKRLKRPVTLETVLSAYNKGYSKKLANSYIKKYKVALIKLEGKRVQNAQL